jgi:hypothetical protein
VPSSQRKTAPTSPLSLKNMDPISDDDSEDDTGGARGSGRTGSGLSVGKRSPSGLAEKGAQRKASIEAWGEDKVGDVDGGEKIVMSERQRSPRKSILHMGSKGVVKSTDLIGGARDAGPTGGAGGGRAAGGGGKETKTRGKGKGRRQSIAFIMDTPTHALAAELDISEYNIRVQPIVEEGRPPPGPPPGGTRRVGKAQARGDGTGGARGGGGGGGGGSSSNSSEDEDDHFDAQGGSDMGGGKGGAGRKGGKASAKPSSHTSHRREIKRMSVCMVAQGASNPRAAGPLQTNSASAYRQRRVKKLQNILSSVDKAGKAQHTQVRIADAIAEEGGENLSARNFAS